jgi:quercetin dioxygenase-like cupin family protein
MKHKSSIYLEFALIMLFLIATALTYSFKSTPGLSQPNQAEPGGIKRTELQRSDLSTPGREVIQSRIDFAPGMAFGKHSHPGEEIIYVLEGQLEYQVDGKPPVALRAGEVLFIPAGTVHSAKNVGQGKGVELATYVVEKGKPLVVLVK